MKGEKRTFSWRKSRQVSSLGQYVIAVSPEENSEEKTHLVGGRREREGASHSNRSRRLFQFPPDRSEEEGPITSPPFATEVFSPPPQTTDQALEGGRTKGEEEGCVCNSFSPPTHEYSFATCQTVSLAARS